MDLLETVKYCNSRSVIIGDLKPENIHFTDPKRDKEKRHIKLIDF